MTTNTRLEVFSTAPQSSACDRSAYLRNVIDVARWSEEFGCKGILVYSDNSLVDPWLVSQIIIEHTETLCPLVAVQPVYMHPYTVAKMLATFAHLYGRRLYLNYVAGGFKNDLAALADTTPHDARYARLAEYAEVIDQLLAGATVTYEGTYYQVRNLRLAPPVEPALRPGVFLSGSSDAGLDTARKLGATAIQYPRPVQECRAAADVRCGIRVGMIARGTRESAWRVAEERFPEDRKGEIAHQLAMKVSDSVWHRQLSNSAEPNPNPTYWLRPFQTYKSFCPYLVGDYSDVGDEVSAYVNAGFRTFILDIPPSREELEHIGKVLERVRSKVLDVAA